MITANNWQNGYKKKVWVSWSGGKDALLAMEAVRSDAKYECAGLITTVRASDRRVAVHGIPESLIRKQSERMGLDLHVVELPDRPTNLEYEQVMHGAFRFLEERGAWGVAYGDISLDDIKAFRQGIHRGSGLEPVFPLWGIDCKEVSERFIAGRHRALVVSIDPETAPEDLLGRDYNKSFTSGLGGGVDPCGENGEFHTFVYDGPLFSQPVRFEKGAIRRESGYFLSMDLASVDE